MSDAGADELCRLVEGPDGASKSGFFGYSNCRCHFCGVRVGIDAGANARTIRGVVRWLHVPLWVVIVSLVAFVRLYLRAGRPMARVDGRRRAKIAKPTNGINHLLRGQRAPAADCIAECWVFISKADVGSSNGGFQVQTRSNEERRRERYIVRGKAITSNFNRCIRLRARDFVNGQPD